MPINARSKGQRGEREVVHLLQPVIDAVYKEQGIKPPVLERNLMQWSKGGFDIVGLDWLALEVKFQEADHIEQWWEQCLNQASERDENGVRRLIRTPVLFFRRSKQKWNVMMRGKLPCTSPGPTISSPCVVSLSTFLLWFHHEVRTRLDLHEIEMLR